MMRIAVAVALILLLTTPSSAGEEPLFVIHFTVGPSWNKEKPPAEQEHFSEHSANLGALRKAGTILFGARYEEVGMIVVRSTSLDSARELIESDPGVAAGLFTFTIAPLYPFYEWKE
ncbi:MAG: YciI family protein [Ignavibacteria bacterium]|nr:YciI family protein [Ignavibacteria bacterium]